ncbi:MAG: hypothetical protein H0X01_01070 [Nitrospira sp.]|nr:hypothetical protein [Nitrospira sp.]
MDYLKLAQIAVQEVLNEYGEHTCIAMAGVLMTVLRLDGVDGAYPLTVHVKILNPNLTKLASSVKSPSEAQMKRWGAQQGSFMVSLGEVMSEPDGWPGHLVVIVPDAVEGRTIMLDLTIMQADQPQYGIRLRPIALKLDREILATKTFGVVQNGCQIMYKAFPDDLTYQEKLAWQRSDLHDLVATRILSRLYS